jgi:hypothetical protein
MTEYNGYRHFAGIKGSKEIHVGQDPTAFQYIDLASAVADAEAGSMVYIHPGTYTLTAQLAINKPLKLVGLGGAGELGGVKITSTTLAAALVAVELVAQTAAASVSFKDIHFQHGVADNIAMTINNTAVGQALTVTFENCNVLCSAATSTAAALVVGHTDVATAVTVKMRSSMLNQVGSIAFTAKNAADVLELVGMDCSEDGLASAIITSADAVTMAINCWYCRFKTAAAVMSGGDAAQLARVWMCTTESVGALYVEATDNTGAASNTYGLPDS